MQKYDSDTDSESNVCFNAAIVIRHSDSAVSMMQSMHGSMINHVLAITFVLHCSVL